jgi:hypothetical protein
MELGVVVRRADLCIVDAAADMKTYPHAECTDIEPSFRHLVGLSVARGYTNAVSASGASVVAVTSNSWLAPWGRSSCSR